MQTIEEVLDYHWQTLKTQGATLFTSDQANTQTISLVLTLPLEISQSLHSQLIKLLPHTDNLLIQPPAQYHITIQWTYPQEFYKNQREIIAECEEVLKNVRLAPISLTFPYLSVVGLLARVSPEEPLILLRHQMNKIWDKYRLTKGVDGIKGQFFWLSLARFTSSPTQKLLNQLHNLPTHTIENVKPNQILLAINDPLLSPTKTKILIAHTT